MKWATSGVLTNTTAPTMSHKIDLVIAVSTMPATIARCARQGGDAVMTQLLDGAREPGPRNPSNARPHEDGCDPQSAASPAAASEPLFLGEAGLRVGDHAQRGTQRCQGHRGKAPGIDEVIRPGVPLDTLRVVLEANPPEEAERVHEVIPRAVGDHPCRGGATKPINRVVVGETGAHTAGLLGLK